MEDFRAAPLEPDDALAAADSILAALRRVLVGARRHLSDGDRSIVARETRKRVANVCAEVDWILLGRLNTCDRDVLGALVELEPATGVEFRTTGYEIWEHTRHSSQAVVYVALRRLDYLGLIRRTSGRGHAGTRVQILWGQIPTDCVAIKAAT